LTDMGPGSFCGEVWHAVLRVFVIEYAKSAKEFWTCFVRTGVAVAAAVNTASSAVGVALGSAVGFCAGATGVSGVLAISGNVTETLTLRAAEWLFLVLVNTEAFFVYADAITKDVVRDVCVSDLNEGKGFALVVVTAGGRFDPAYSGEGVFWQLVFPFDVV
jgi:hypothetical protein